MPYALAPGFSFCEPSGRRIFLDLPGDRYFCLSDETDVAFSALVTGVVPSADDEARLESLRKNGMLEASPSADPPRPCGPCVITSSPLDGEPVARFRAIAVARAAWRLKQAKRALRRRPLHLLCADFCAAKARLWRRDVSTDQEALAELAIAFRASGRLVEALDECLAVSLALAHQAVARRFRPELVLGVRLRPFQAHAWVVVDGMLISDRLHVVRQFTPILIL